MSRVGTGKLREQNDRIVLELLFKYYEVTKKELAKYSSLTVATIGTIFNDFLNDQIIIEKEIIYSKKGRPAKKYLLNPNYFHSLCLFVQRKGGNDYVCWQIIDAVSNVVEQGKEELLNIKVEDIVNFIVNILQGNQNIQIIGLGIPAVISNGKIIESDLPNLKNVDLQKVIETATNLKTVLKNDMNYTAYGYYLDAHDKKDLCYVTFPLNSGPGCGSVINGKLLEGQNSIAGEIMYLPFFNYLKQRKQHEFNYSPNNIALSLCCVASIINPSIIILTGEAINSKDLQQIKRVCLEYLPDEFMPELVYREGYEEDYFRGLRELVRASFIIK